jgi:hypothetical protein
VPRTRRLRHKATALPSGTHDQLGAREERRPRTAEEMVGPAGLEPATTDAQPVVDATLTNSTTAPHSTNASTVAPCIDIAALLLRRALEAQAPLPRDVRVALARLFVDGSLPTDAATSRGEPS